MYVVIYLVTFGRHNKSVNAQQITANLSLIKRHVEFVHKKSF